MARSVLETEHLTGIANGEFARAYRDDCKTLKAGPHDKILHPFMLQSAGEIKEKHVVDLGCGHGKLTEMIARLDAASIVAIDVNLDLLSEVAGKNIANVATIHADITGELALPSRHFHVAILNQVVVHLDDQHLMKLIRNLKRLLRAGGKALVTATHFDWATSMYDFHFVSHGSGWADHVRDGVCYREWYRNETEYAELFTKNGFSVKATTLLVPDHPDLELRYRQRLGKPIFHGFEATLTRLT